MRTYLGIALFLSIVLGTQLDFPIWKLISLGMLLKYCLISSSPFVFFSLSGMLIIWMWYNLYWCSTCLILKHFPFFISLSFALLPGRFFFFQLYFLTLLEFFSFAVIFLISLNFLFVLCLLFLKKLSYSCFMVMVYFPVSLRILRTAFFFFLTFF